jgi:hypothetical protein
LGLIWEELAATQDSTFALNVLVMNLEKLLVDRGQRSIRTMPLNAQMAAG